MFLLKKNDTLTNRIERDLEDSIIENNKLKQTIRNLESKVNEEKEKVVHAFLGTLLHTNSNGVKLYVTNCRTLFPNTCPWDFNRPIDKTHVDKLKKIVLKKGYLEGYFDILKCDNKLSIVNGQHRYKAIIEIMEDEPNFDLDIYCNVHTVPNIWNRQFNV